MSDERKYMGIISRIILSVVFLDFFIFLYPIMPNSLSILSPNFYLLITNDLFALIYLLQIFK